MKLLQLVKEIVAALLWINHSYSQHLAFEVLKA